MIHSCGYNKSGGIRYEPFNGDETLKTAAGGMINWSRKREREGDFGHMLASAVNI